MFQNYHQTLLPAKSVSVYLFIRVQWKLLPVGCIWSLLKHFSSIPNIFSENSSDTLQQKCHRSLPTHSTWKGRKGEVVRTSNDIKIILKLLTGRASCLSPSAAVEVDCHGFTLSKTAVLMLFSFLPLPNYRPYRHFALQWYRVRKTLLRAASRR